MQKGADPKQVRKPQSQEMPGIQAKMTPKPISLKPAPLKKLDGKVALITGGDSGIGRATALLFAREGADIALSYLTEHEDAEEVKRVVEEEFAQTCLLLPGDIRKEKQCA
ncbi:MAG TPA: SDR family NAD(P)-dependent oxidoreductase, partial [Flavisolibacter sp.]|nr:SDR family NAD(P)-dependent oxidoreductase [Flavisolibacter sp.]